MLDIELHVTLHECCKAVIYKHEGQSIAVFRSLKVSPSKRRKGYGDRLLATLEDIARGLGCDSSVLWVSKLSWMHDWYKRRGYEDYDDYYDPSFVWMWKSLRKTPRIR